MKINNDYKVFPLPLFSIKTFYGCFFFWFEVIFKEKKLKKKHIKTLKSSFKPELKIDSKKKRFTAEVKSEWVRLKAVFKQKMKQKIRLMCKADESGEMISL